MGLGAFAFGATLPAGSAELDIASSVLQYGVLGIAAYFLFQYARAATKREQDRADRLEVALESKNRDLMEMMGKVLPALAEVTTASRDTSALLVRYATELAIRQERRDGR